MKKLVLENERLIEAFNINDFLDIKEYQIAASLGALETTNEIAKCFISNREKILPREEHILRLYAILQGLFVSIDSLYALTLALTKSKNFININNNKNLRQIKYIRNDVVGHPSNRVLGEATLAFCILDDKSIDSYHFVYNIYTINEIVKKEVIIDDLLNDYYKESSYLLKELYSITKNTSYNIKLKSKASLMMEGYLKNNNYSKYLNDIIVKYKNKMPSATIKTSRILWRYSLIKVLESLELSNSYEYDLANYCIGLELAKIYKLITKLEYSFKRKLPKYVLATYKLFNISKNKGSLIYLADSDHPLYKITVDKLILEASELGNLFAKSYLEFLKKYLLLEKYEIVYALTLPLKEYKKK